MLEIVVLFPVGGPQVSGLIRPGRGESEQDRPSRAAGQTLDPSAWGRGCQGAWLCWGRGLGRRGSIAAAAGVLAGGRRARSGAVSRLRDGPRAMAASSGPAGVGGAGPSGFAFDSGLEIKTRSVEQTLLPLVSQVKWRPARPLVSLQPRPAMAAAARTARGRVGPGGRQPLPPILSRTAASGRAACLRLGDRPRLRLRRLVWTIRNPAARPSGLRGGGGRGRGAQCGPERPAGRCAARPAPRDPPRAVASAAPGPARGPARAPPRQRGPCGGPHVCIPSPHPDCWALRPGHSCRPPSPACSPRGLCPCPLRVSARWAPIPAPPAPRATLPAPAP